MMDKLISFIRDTSAYNNELIAMIGRKKRGEKSVEVASPAIKKPREGSMRKTPSRSQPKTSTLTDTDGLIRQASRRDTVLLNDLDQQLIERARSKQLQKKQKAKMELDIARREQSDDKLQALLSSQQEAEKERTTTIVKKFFEKTPMPSFAIFSRLDKDLLRTMLVRATEMADEEVE